MKENKSLNYLSLLTILILIFSILIVFNFLDIFQKVYNIRYGKEKNIKISGLTTLDSQGYNFYEKNSTFFEIKKILRNKIFLYSILLVFSLVIFIIIIYYIKKKKKSNSNLDKVENNYNFYLLINSFLISFRYFLAR